MFDSGTRHVAVSYAENKFVFNASQSQVAVLDPDKDPSMIASLEASSVGESFGASLATGDLNQDGWDDLVVGAPHWKNDNGRVYVYLGTPKVNFLACD